MDGIMCPTPRATPFVFPDVGRLGVSGDRMAQVLVEEAGVAVYGGAAYGPAGKNRVRINFATAKPVLKEALDRIEARLSRPLTP
jgi:aspartate aminotransferase